MPISQKLEQERKGLVDKMEDGSMNGIRRQYCGSIVFISSSIQCVIIDSFVQVLSLISQPFSLGHVHIYGPRII